MNLSQNLASKFAKLTNGEKQTSRENVVYGTIKEYNGVKYVLFDGADILTPVTTTVEFEDGERVTVLLKDHTATVTGNITSPASRNTTVEIIGNRVNLMAKTSIYTGDEPPEKPELGALWLDTSVDPNMLKQYTDKETWLIVGTDALKTSSIDIRNNKIDISSGGSISINSGASIDIKSGGSFTVDASNLDIDSKGVITANKAELTEATVNGKLSVNGYAVWHAGNIVVSSSEPTNPTVGMIWINPNGGSSSGGDDSGGDDGGDVGGDDGYETVLEGTYYADALSSSYVFSNSNNNTYSGYFEGNSLGSLDSGEYTYTIQLPLYSSNQYGTHWARATIWTDNSNGSVTFPEQSYDSYGMTWYEQSITVDSDWFGDSSIVYFEVEVAHNNGSFPSGTYGDMQYRKGYQASLTMTGLGIQPYSVATFSTRAISSGWKNAAVKYYTG